MASGALGSVVLICALAATGCGRESAPAVSVWPVPSGAQILATADVASGVASDDTTRLREIIVTARDGRTARQLRRAQTMTATATGWRRLPGHTVLYFENAERNLWASVTVVGPHDLAFEPEPIVDAVRTATRRGRPALLVTVRGR